MLKRLNKTFRLALLTAALAFAQQVNAIQIDGTIDFTGGVSISQTGTTAAVHFFPSASVDGEPFASNPTGHYSEIMPGTDATFTDFSYDTLTLALTPTSLNVWEVVDDGVTYTFTLDHLSSATLADPQYGTMIQGTGVANITGGVIDFDPTPGTFVLAGSGTSTRFRFSSGTSVSPGSGTSVPDGGSAVALLGITMIGLEGLRRGLIA